jgi:hypothetical protein
LGFWGLWVQFDEYVEDAVGGKLYFLVNFDRSRVTVGANEVALNLEADIGQAEFRDGKFVGWVGQRLGMQLPFEFSARAGH